MKTPNFRSRSPEGGIVEFLGVKRDKVCLNSRMMENGQDTPKQAARGRYKSLEDSENAFNFYAMMTAIFGMSLIVMLLMEKTIWSVITGWATVMFGLLSARAHGRLERERNLEDARRLRDHEKGCAFCQVMREFGKTKK